MEVRLILCPGEYTYVNTDSSGLTTIYICRKIFQRDIFNEFPNSFCEDVVYFVFVLFPNKNLIYLLRNRDRNAWCTEVGPRKDT